MKKNTRRIDIIIIIVLVLLLTGIGLTIYNSRKKNTSRTSPVSQTKTVTANDYNGKKIGILTGTNMEQESFKQFPDSEYFYFKGYPDLNTALLNGTIDAYLGDEPALKSIHSAQPEIDYIKKRLTNNKYSFAFRKNDEKEKKICEQLNEFLEKANADGTIAEIDSIWFGNDDSKKVVDMSDLKDTNGTIHIITTTTDEPFSYIKDNKNVGYDIDVTARFCREYGYALEIGDVDFSARIPALESGKYEFTTSMNVTPEREEEVMFSDPVSTGGIVVAVRSEDINNTDKELSIEELNAPSRHVGADTGASGMIAVEKYLPKADLKLYDELTTGLESVKMGKIDAFVFERQQMEIAMENGLTGVRLLEENLGESIEVAIGISRVSKVDDLQGLLNEFIEQAKADGTLDDMYERWVVNKDYTMPQIDKPESADKKIIIGTTAVVEPYSFYKDNTLTGYDIELAKRFALWADAEIEFKIYDYSGIIAAASSGKIDCIFANLNVTDERKEKIDFSNAIYTIENAVMVKDDSAGSNSTDSDESFMTTIKNSFNKNFIREDRYKLILQGIMTTCVITLLSVIFGTILAFLICIFRRTGSRLANIISNIYVKLLQGTPMVVLLMILYYVIFGKTGISAVWVAIIGFTLNFGAYTSEIMRSGIESVDAGQREAALALGYTERKAFFKFIFPQAAVRFLPVYKGELISLLKSTSIVGYIAIQDLTKMSDIIRSRTYEAFFPLIISAVIYFILAWILSLITGFILRQADPRKRRKKAKEAE
ncbi:MAG: ABC transporter permease subunit [Ruminococcus sp.]|nr:ABC transporter permease subunit [Ruminococcus sp.]